jgi:outer membrane protein assembly factor BamB
MKILRSFIQTVRCTHPTLVGLLVLLVTPSLRADDWPQWRGPERTGISKETGLLKEWPEGGPKLLWKATGLGIGYASPAVVGSKVFILGTKGEDEYVLCRDAATGDLLWSRKIGLIGENTGPNYPGPRATPTVAKDVLYALGSDGDLVCLRTADGSEVWHKHLEKEFKGNRGTWAYCESPLLDGDRLICTPGGTEATFLALDAKTGAVVWKTGIAYGGNQAGYASMIAVPFAGRKLYVQFLGSGITAVDAEDGKFLWRYNGNIGGISANTPIAYEDCIFTSASGLTKAGGDALLKLTHDNGKFGFKELYLVRNMDCFHGGVVCIGDYVYGTGKVGLVCLDIKTGKKKWADRGIGQGALLAADGRLYVRGTSGEVALVEINSAKYVERGRFNQPFRSKYNAFAHPVVANGRLYLRDADKLLCFDVRQK